MKTPRYFTRTIAAGAFETIQAYGRYIQVISVSASTIRLGIDDEQPQQILDAMRIEVGEPYQRIRLNNVGLVPATVILYVSDLPVEDSRQASGIGGLAVSLANIDADCDNLALILAALGGLVVTSTPVTYGAATPIPMTTVLVDGGGATQLVVANAATTRVDITANPDNVGNVYLAFLNTVTSTLCITVLAPGGSWSCPWNGDVFACSDNGTEEVTGAVY